MNTDERVAIARQQTLGDIPRRTANRLPNKIGIIDGDLRLTFAEFELAVARTAAGMHADGISKGDRVALLSHNCWQFAVVSFATARLGVILVPINFMLGADEIAFILDHSEASVFIAEDNLTEVADQAIASADTTIGVRVCLPLGAGVASGWRSITEWIDYDETAPPEVLVGDDDPIRLMYTCRASR